MRSRPGVEAATAGALAGVSALAVGELVAALSPGARSPAAGLGRALIDATPGPAIDVGVALVGERDKPLMAAALTGGFALAGAAGALLGRFGPGPAALATLAPSVVGVGYGLRLPGGRGTGTAAAALAAAAVVPLMQARARRPAAAGIVAAVNSAAAVAVWRDRRRRDQQAHAGIVVSAGTVLPPPAADTYPRVPGLAPLITPPENLYKVDVTFPAPRVDPLRWRLCVDGDVDEPLELTLPELLSMDTAETDALLVCVHNPVGGHRMGNGRWTVVPLDALLDRAGLPDDLAADPAGAELVARAVDGFTVSMPLTEALDRALIAVGLGGRPLPFGNGFPARLLVPGRYGYAGNVKWLAGLEVRRTPAHGGPSVPGYWTSRRWPANGGGVGASSRIDVPHAGARLSPGPVTVAGYAWAPPAGVRGVEVSVDDGPWQEARLADELSPLSWRAWTFRWDAAPGSHVLRVRCAGVGGDQDERDAAPYPDGPTGVHAVPVLVGAGRWAGPAGGALARLRHTARARVRLAVDSGRAWREI